VRVCLRNLSVCQVLAPGDAADRSIMSLGFPFGYIDAQSLGLKHVITKMYPPEKGPTTDIPNSGPAPMLMRIDELFRVRCLASRG
jgi:hypothetical protein